MQRIKLTDTASFKEWPFPLDRQEEVVQDSTKWSEALKIWGLQERVGKLEEVVEGIENKLNKVTCLSVQIFDLNNPKYKLNLPITVLVNKENGEFFAEAVDFDIFGEGESEKEAIYNLKKAIINYYESLEASKKLSKNLKSKLRLLRKTIKSED